VPVAARESGLRPWGGRATVRSGEKKQKKKRSSIPLRLYSKLCEFSNKKENYGMLSAAKKFLAIAASLLILATTATPANNAEQLVKIRKVLTR